MVCDFAEGIIHTFFGVLTTITRDFLLLSTLCCIATQCPPGPHRNGVAVKIYEVTKLQSRMHSVATTVRMLGEIHP